MTLNHINATVIFDTIVAFHIIVAIVIPLVALIMPTPVMWHEEHVWNFSVLKGVHLSHIVAVKCTDFATCNCSTICIL
jgi:hypothetical protein